MMPMCKQIQTLLHVPSSGHNHKMDVFNPHRQKEKVVIVMGATGTGKSRLSIDLATCFPAEIINSDKMQVYEGLDIVTNKITKEEQRGVPHHLLGMLDPHEDFTARDFCRDRLPIIVGGSNSYIEALIDDYDYKFRSKYECCFLWVDVSTPVLHSFVSKRVDHMVQNGMVDEAREYFDPNADYTKGIRRAIGVPEFDKYFRYGLFLDEETRARLLQQAVDEIKDNTCKLAWWNLHPLDATEVFRKRGEEADEAWKKLVSGPSAMFVGQFLYNMTAEVPPHLGSLRVLEALAAATH
ncbi:adenylate isopentenyltransferase [Pyrus ussuriensis x Pyrus communis]|uniref:adenylate dimethylallyltransferase (ADP/ATP-dependent) n=1 Tax=Pyrus ussuriensis x Pyrus communis TaxID=2448454 RepID=A0A5N5FGY2_9ROSA|nr:adenylate isopentenyltransferase [Pyrus ussuriensis x Pyrus communis]